MRDNYIAFAGAAKSRLVIPDFSSGVDFFSDESVTAVNRAKDCYNFCFSDGALKEGYGLIEYERFKGIRPSYVWLYKRYDIEKEMQDDRFVIVSEEGELYSCTANGSEPAVKFTGITFTSPPSFVNYRLYGTDVVLICSAREGMYVYDGENTPYHVDNAPNITSMALHYERLFVTVDGEKNAVWFSDDLDPTNWDSSLAGGGFIQMIDERGALNRVISYLNYVYVFRDYGISRITAFGAQTDFSVSNLFVSSGKIYPGSVALCGDSVIFLAADGLYMFDGVSTKKILKGLDTIIESGENACAFYAEGKYYLSFRRKKDEDTVGCEDSSYLNNALLVLDINGGDYSMARGLDITCFCHTAAGSIIAVTSNCDVGTIEKCGRFFSRYLKKKWRVPKTDLGDDKTKFVREICLTINGNVSIVLRSDTREKEVFFRGFEEVKKKRVSFSGRRIGFDIVSTDDSVYVSRPSLIITKSGN